MTRWLNRSAFVVRPRQPFSKWKDQLNAEDGILEDNRNSDKDVSVYLVREDEKGRNETPPLQSYYRRVFEAELEAWCTDPDQWPQDRTLKLFELWFEVTGESIVVDLEDSEIEVENL